MEWTREQRYLPYADWDAQTLLQLQAQAARSQYQLHYHIHPLSGLLNDPNGFSYFNGEWHVFYQSYPFGPVHGRQTLCTGKTRDSPLRLILRMIATGRILVQRWLSITN